MPEDMPDRMPEDMPDRMPEDMSDRMPEDLLASGFASPEGDRRVEAPLPGAAPGGDWPPFRKGFRAS